MPRPANMVPNQPIREAYHASGLSAMEVCERLGWDRRDTSRLHRQIGQMAWQSSRQNGGAKNIQTVLDRNTAIKLAAILEVDFDELYEGLLPPERPQAYCKSCGDPMRGRHKTGKCGFCLEEEALYGQVAVAA